MGAIDSKRIMSENIQRYMDCKGVTRQQLCDALGLKYTTLRDWLKGNTYPRIGKVEAMANYFGCKKSDLIEDKKATPVFGDDLSDKQRMAVAAIRAMPKEEFERKYAAILSILDL